MLLTISNLHVSTEKKEILQGVSLKVRSGEVHALMGPNGSGKSTFAYALMGHPAYKVLSTKSKILINKKNIIGLSTEERAKAGLFLAFQSPMAIPGVTVMNLLRTACGDVKDRTHNPLLSRRYVGVMPIGEFIAMVRKHAVELHIDESFLSRGINDGFSGGEKKKMEMLTALVLAPKFAVFDEIDTGLDVDALRIVARGIETLASRGTGVIVITHYQRILKYIKPDRIHILVNGKIIKTGSALLAQDIEDHGYARYAV